MRLAELVARMEYTSNTYKIVVGKPERKRPFWSPGFSRENDIKLDEGGCVRVDWVCRPSGFGSGPVETS
jgi:hypothetical protein